MVHKRLTGYRMPAEFEHQSAVWFGWPKFQWYTYPELDTRRPISQIIETLSEHQIVARIMCTDSAGELSAKNWMTEHGYKITPYTKFVHIDQVDIWTRDFGPIFVRNDTKELGMVSFQQNQWGYSTTTNPISKAMAAVPRLVADYLGIKNNFSTQAVSEGGDRIVNGEGVLFVDRAVEFQRNPQASQNELEEVFSSLLGVSKIVWFNNGVREDLHADWGPIPYKATTGETILLYGPQTTGGHLDEFVRFSSPNSVILAQVSEDEAAHDPISAINYSRLEEAYRILSSVTDQDDGEFQVSRIPVPDIEYIQIDPNQPMYGYLAKLKYPADVPQFPAKEPVFVVKSASYANYLVTNGLVVAPKYGNIKKDAAAARTLEAAYSGRKVVQIDASPINYAGGGIHCSTQQQPTGIL